MAKASDNVFPKVITAVQSTDIAAPSDGSWKLYSKPGGIYARSSNSVVGPFATSAAAGAMTRIQQIVSSGSATETFSGIAGTYETLVIHYSGRSDRAANNFDNLLMRFNGDTGANYCDQQVQGANSTVSSFQNLNGTSIIAGELLAASADANASNSGIITIPGYARTVFQKSTHSVYGGFPSTTTGKAVEAIGRWKSTSAITSITLFPLGNFISGTVFTLYGIT
jgi:hypothetical protein